MKYKIGDKFECNNLEGIWMITKVDLEDKDLPYKLNCINKIHINFPLWVRNDMTNKVMDDKSGTWDYFEFKEVK